jgi:hypothetical protein
MVKHEVVTTDAQIQAALEGAKRHDKDPVAQAVEHIPDLNLLLVKLSNGRRLVLPVEDLQDLDRATHQQIKNYKLLGLGTGIHFPELDVDLYVPALIEGVYGPNSLAPFELAAQRVEEAVACQGAYELNR